MSECPCFYSGAGECMPSAYRDTWRKARKAHRCCECGETIEPGARYLDTTGVWEGGPNRYRTCEGCAEIREAFNCDGWIFGELWDAMIASGLVAVERAPAACLFAELSPVGADRLKRYWSELVDREVE